MSYKKNNKYYLDFNKFFIKFTQEYDHTIFERTYFLLKTLY